MGNRSRVHGHGNNGAVTIDTRTESKAVWRNAATPGTVSLKAMG
jgi:hypothetical protein